MKRKYSLLPLVSMLLVLSCMDDGIQNDIDRATKLNDAHANNPTQNVPAIYWKCKILTNTVNLTYDYYSIGDRFLGGPMGQTNPYTNKVVPIQYNEANNPSKIRRYEYAADSTVYIFSYTPLQQLKRITMTEYNFVVDHLNYKTTFDFIYEGNTLTITRTKTVSNGTPPYDDGSRKIYFDTEGRIKEKRYYLHSTDATPHHIMKYAYNSAGNLLNIQYVVPNEGQKMIAEFYSYDNQKNIYGSNKVWQLLFEQYSKNNPTYFISWHAASSTSKTKSIVTYSNYNLGYPTHLYIEKSDFNFTTNQWFPPQPMDADVTYDCYGTL